MAAEDDVVVEVAASLKADNGIEYGQRGSGRAQIPAYRWDIDFLRRVPPRYASSSADPLLTVLSNLDLRSIDWLVAGGETGAPP